MIAFQTDPSRVIYGDRTTNGTILTVPAGQTWTGDIQVAASVSAAATGTPNVTVSGTNAVPPPGTVISRLSITGLALSTVTDSNTISAIITAPAENSITLQFDTGGATSASVVCNGFYL